MHGIVFGLLVSASVQLGGDSADRALLDKMRSAQSALSSLKASIEQIKTYPQLGIEDPPERGTLVVLRDGDKTSVRLAIEQPERRVLISKGTDYVLYQPRIKQAVVGTVAQGSKATVFARLLTGSPDAFEELERGYELLSDASPVDDAHELSLVARDSAEVYCTRIDLRIDPSSGIPTMQRCHEANGSTITMTLSNVEIDPDVDRSVFDLKLPKDVEKVRG